LLPFAPYLATQVVPAESLYAGVDPSKQSATSQTAYKWAFASKRTKADDEALRTARTEVGAATYGADSKPPKPGDGSSKRVQGPALPPQDDCVLAREAEEEKAAAEREYQRKRDRAEARDRIEDMVGPREVGRERMLEKKRERREGDRAFRERGDEGLEMDEGTLMGGADSFKAQWVLPIITHVPALMRTRVLALTAQNCPQRCCACSV
jgi:type IV secretory pathway VirB10-like protein